MKALLFVAILITSLTSQAEFIQSGYLYGLSARHEVMVESNSDYILGAHYKEHGNWINLNKMVKEQVTFTGVNDHYIEELKAGKRWDRLKEILFAYEPYFCANWDEYYWDKSSNEDCIRRTKVLLGDALKKADSVKLVHVFGDYYGDFEFVNVIFSDFKTKETITLEFGIGYEI